MHTDQTKIQQFKKWFKNKTVLENERDFILDITATKVRGFYDIGPNRYVIENSHIIIANFGFLNLKEIPESLRNLLHLKKLNLSHNKLRTLPENIQELKNLEYLDISFNRFETLPSTLEDLPNLKILQVKGNNFDKDALKLLERLRDRNISIVDLLCHMNEWHYFPSTLPHHTCPSCEILICGRCIGQLLADSRIECVWCGEKFDPRPIIENMVSSKNLIDKKYGECLKLMLEKNYEAAVKAFRENQSDNESDASYWFNIGFSLNALGRYAEANKCWEKANKLRPRHIDTITNWRVALKYLGRTEELIRVDLNENLDSKELDFLEELEIIKKYKKPSRDHLLRWNVEIKDSHIEKLKILWRASSSDKYPKSMGNLAILKDLEITANNIHRLPESIGNLKNLERLVLHKPQLKFLPESIGNLENLTELKIEISELTTLPDSIGNLKNLKNIDILGKRGGLILPPSIGKMINLRSLNIRGGIEPLPDTLFNLKNLRYLNLKFNLKTLPNLFSGLIDLEYLDLWGNQLRSLPSSICLLKHLEYLDLRENQLESVPDGILHLKQLKELWLQDNPELEIDLNELKEELPNTLIHENTECYEDGERIYDLNR